MAPMVAATTATAIPVPRWMPSWPAFPYRPDFERESAALYEHWQGPTVAVMLRHTKAGDNLDEFSFTVVIAQSLIGSGVASVRRKLPRLHADKARPDAILSWRSLGLTSSRFPPDS